MRLTQRIKEIFSLHYVQGQHDKNLVLICGLKNLEIDFLFCVLMVSFDNTIFSGWERENDYIYERFKE